MQSTRLISRNRLKKARIVCRFAWMTALSFGIAGGFVAAAPNMGRAQG